MSNANNINKAAFYILIKSKSTVFNMLGISLFCIFALGVFQLGQFYSKSADYRILVLYAVLLGCTLIQANSMIIDLTAKDRISRRTEYFLASGIELKLIIRTYTAQIFKISSIVPFITFIACYYITDLKIPFFLVIAFFTTTVLLGYSEILFFNTIIFSVEKYKLFKNMVFFGNFFLVYLIGMCADEIVAFALALSISMDIFIIAMNAIIAMILLMVSFRKLSIMDNESVIRSVGQWI